jgi:hypothetical protein
MPVWREQLRGIRFAQEISTKLLWGKIHFESQSTILCDRLRIWLTIWKRMGDACR